jgi:hypothetical protein
VADRARPLLKDARDYYMQRTSTARWATRDDQPSHLRSTSGRSAWRGARVWGSFFVRASSANLTHSGRKSVTTTQGSCKTRMQRTSTARWATRDDDSRSTCAARRVGQRGGVHAFGDRFLSGPPLPISRIVADRARPLLKDARDYYMQRTSTARWATRDDQPSHLRSTSGRSAWRGARV